MATKGNNIAIDYMNIKIEDTRQILFKNYCRRNSVKRYFTLEEIFL